MSILKAIKHKRLYKRTIRNLNQRGKDELSVREIIGRNENLKIDISEKEKITLQIAPAYREDVIIVKEGRKVEVIKERCVPDGPDDVGSDFDILLTFEV